MLWPEAHQIWAVHQHQVNEASQTSRESVEDVGFKIAGPDIETGEMWARPQRLAHPFLAPRYPDHATTVCHEREGKVGELWEKAAQVCAAVGREVNQAHIQAG